MSNFFMFKRLKPNYINSSKGVYLYDNERLLNALWESSVNVVVTDVQGVLNTNYNLIENTRILGYNDNTEQKEKSYKHFVTLLPTLYTILEKEKGEMYLFIDKNYTQRLYQISTEMGFTTEILQNESNYTLDKYSTVFDIVRLTHNTSTSNTKIKEIITDVDLQQEPLQLVTSLLQNMTTDKVVLDFNMSENICLACSLANNKYIGCTSSNTDYEIIKNRIDKVLNPNSKENKILNEYSKKLKIKNSKI